MSSTAEFGPLRVIVTRDGIPATEDPDAPAWAHPRPPHNVEKLLARWALLVNGEPVLTDAPFVYGSTQRREPANAEDILESVALDLGSVVDHLHAEQLDGWLSWLDEHGMPEDTPALRESMTTYRELRARALLVAEQLGDDISGEGPAGVPVDTDPDELRELLDAYREHQDGEL